MNESTIKNPFLRGLRQSLVVTLLLLLLCGFVFPMVLSGLSAVIFPSQASGSLVYADGEAVGAATVRATNTATTAARLPASPPAPTTMPPPTPR